MILDKSKRLFSEAVKYLPGGVNSPVRAYKSVGGNPVFIKKGIGSKVYDVDGNEYIDYIGSWGPHLFGHNFPDIKNALLAAIENGTSFGAPTELETDIAKLISELVPSVEMVRMVNSGTEATMSAIRLARGFTKRNKFIKFEGCYHGHADYFLIKAGSGALTLGVPTSPGVTEANAQDTLVADYNNIDSVKALVKANKNNIAAVIIEPVVGNIGVVIPTKSFIKELVELCKNEGILLIFDEVMTGFRLSKGGAQELFGVTPDLSTFGKIIGGGLPVGAFGGRKDIMQMLAPAGPVYQAGTLSGNPLAMSAGFAALSYIKNHPGIYSELDKKGKQLEDGFNENLKKLNLDYKINRVGSMMSIFFTSSPVVDYNTAITSDTKKFSTYFSNMLNRNIFLPPSQFEAAFISLMHSDEDIEKTIEANYLSLKEII